MGDCDEDIDCEVNCVIDQILREDRLESMGLNRCADSSAVNCEVSVEVGISNEALEIFTNAINCQETAVDQGIANCAIETSARFSIRILEALRAVQRQKSTQSWPSCSMEEIVQYIRRHYHHDGDLCSQVETALNQVTGQGFVLKMGINRYHLTGPFACSVQKPTPPNLCGPEPGCGSRSRSGCQGGRRRGTPIANSTFASFGAQDAPVSMDRLSAVSDAEDPRRDSARFQNRSNPPEGGIFAGDPAGGEEFNEDRTLSVIEEIHPPIPQEPVRRVGGNGDRVVVPDHSSDENMFRDEPVRNVVDRSRSQSPPRRCRRGSSSSSNSLATDNDSVLSRSVTHRHPSGRRRRGSNCGSDADVSDDEFDEPEHVRPWMRNCQNENFTLSGSNCCRRRRCSNSARY